MLILKEINKIKSELALQTGIQVTQVSVDVTSELLVVWVDLYDDKTDDGYSLKFEAKLEVLTQFSNDRIIREIIKQLHQEWAEYATSVVTIH